MDIMQLLIQHGAQMEKDAYGMTPLVSAAVVGHKNVVEYLVTRPVCSIEEHINALELLGATYIDRKHNLVEGGLNALLCGLYQLMVMCRQV